MRLNFFAFSFVIRLPLDKLVMKKSSLFLFIISFSLDCERFIKAKIRYESLIDCSVTL